MRIRACGEPPYGFGDDWAASRMRTLTRMTWRSAFWGSRLKERVLVIRPRRPPPGPDRQTQYADAERSRPRGFGDGSQLDRGRESEGVEQTVQNPGGEQKPGLGSVLILFDRPAGRHSRGFWAPDLSGLPASLVKSPAPRRT